MSTLQARHRWDFQIITNIWSHYHIDTLQQLAAFGWRNHLAFLCFHALPPWVSLDWILTGQLGLWKLRGFPSSQLNRMESSSQPTTLRWSNMSHFKFSICWNPLVKVTTHVGSDCVLDCLLARGTEFGTVTIISLLQYFFYFRLFCFRQLFGEFWRRQCWTRWAWGVSCYDNSLRLLAALCSSLDRGLNNNTLLPTDKELRRRFFCQEKTNFENHYSSWDMWTMCD